MLARLRSFTRSLLRRRDFEAQLNEEVELHLELRAADLERSGLGRKEARRQARLELGARETYREQCREARGLRFFDELAADLRYAVRGLKSSPAFALVAVLTLGLAMAANLAFFTLFDAFVFRPLPIRAPDRYVDLMLVNERGGVDRLFTAEELVALKPALAAAFEELYGSDFFQLPMFEPEKRIVHGQAISAGYFSLLEARPAFGRGFLPTEDGTAGQEAPAVLSDTGWKRLFQGDPAVLGKKLRLGTTWFTVVGVMAPDFHGIHPITPEVWIPLGAHQLLAARPGEPPRYDLSGTLRPGASHERASELGTAAIASLGTRAGTLRATAEAGGPEQASEKYTLRVEPRVSWIDAGERRGMKGVGALLFAAFLLVLSIACANLASLHLARASARQREIATRLSLGSSRFRLVRQLLTESLLLSGLGAALGTGLAFASTEAIHQRVFSLATTAGLTLTPISIHWHVVAYATVLALAAGLAFGLLPAWTATAPDLAGASRRDAPALGGGIRRQRLTGLLIAAQVAGSLVLLTLAGLLLRTVSESSRLDPGFDPERLVEARFPNPTPEVAAQLLDRPEVAALTAVARVPLSEGIPGYPMRVDGKSHELRFNFVDQRYFETLGIRVEQGRSFWPEETAAGSPVVMVSAATARLLWPGANPLGRTIEIEPDPDGEVIPPTRYEVVGVAADVVSGFFFRGRDTSLVYFPAAVGSPRIHELLLRPRGEMATLVRAIEDTCQEIDPTVLCEPVTVAWWSNLQRLPFVVASVIAGALGFLALVLTAIGLHGLVAFAVVQRLREVGVRIALGAGAVQVLRTVVSRALGSVLVGVALGLPACWFLSQQTSRIFTLLTGFNAMGLLGAPALLLVIALVAALVPARRAISVDPVVSLRAD